MKRIVIIGNGVAGISAARHIRKLSDHEILVISSETDHFFSRTALMYVFMGHLRFEDTKPYEDAFWSASRIGLLRARVESIDCDRRTLRCSGDREVYYDVLLVATGSRPSRFGWPGQDLPGVQSLYSAQDLEQLEQRVRGIERAVVVGGGLIGVELAEMLTSRGIPVTFLVREESWMSHAFPPAESAMLTRHIREHGIDLRLATELEQIEAGTDGRAAAVHTTSGERLACQLVGLTTGVRPDLGLVESTTIECDRGVLVDHLLRTSVPDVYAAGDCVQLREPRAGRRAIEAVWYVARAMGETVARTICGEPTPYVQGIWFNSAKFFDLEWQVYGDVPAAVAEGQSTVCWQHPSGRALIRINHRAPEGPVTGFNLVGIRYRHELCERWIRDQTPIRDVLADLGAANFDPELYPQHEAEVVAAFNRTHPGKPVVLKRRRGLRSLLTLGRAS